MLYVGLALSLSATALYVRRGLAVIRERETRRFTRSQRTLKLSLTL